MPLLNAIVDLHVHSTLKPYGRSYDADGDPLTIGNSACIWTDDVRTRGDFKLESILGISRYRQSDFKSLTDGRVRIAIVSLYPLEKEFFQINPKPLNFLGEFASMFGEARIKSVEGKEFNYFVDLCKEYDHLRCLSGVSVNAKSYAMLNDTSKLDAPEDLLIIPSFEGCHALCDGNDTRLASNWDNMEANVHHIKNEWKSPPLFVTFAHHFYNGLCTHARSLFDMAGGLVDQKHGMRDFNFQPDDKEEPINERGKLLIDLLLSKKNGRRILIDIKHMSREARITYYQLLQTKYKGEDIPIICSHGALALNDKHEINLHGDDVTMIIATNGLIGLEMDQRILGYNKKFIRFLKKTFRPKWSAYDDAAFVFRQIIKIAEPCYRVNHKADPWRCIALGSDYDGIINPLNHYPDAASLKLLYEQLIVHLTHYWASGENEIPAGHNGLTAADVVRRIMFENAYNFIKKHYKNKITPQ